MHAITPFAWSGRQSLAAPWSWYLAYSYGYSITSRPPFIKLPAPACLWMHGCRHRPTVFMPCPATTHKNRHDGRRNSGTVSSYMYLKVRVPTCLFRGIAFLVSTTTCDLRGYDLSHWGLAIYPMQRQSRLREPHTVVRQVQGGCDVIAHPNGSRQCPYPYELPSTL